MHHARFNIAQNIWVLFYSYPPGGQAGNFFFYCRWCTFGMTLQTEFDALLSNFYAVSALFSDIKGVQYRTINATTNVIYNLAFVCCGLTGYLDILQVLRIWRILLRCWHNMPKYQLTSHTVLYGWQDTARVIVGCRGGGGAPPFGNKLWNDTHLPLGIRTWTLYHHS